MARSLLAAGTQLVLVTPRPSPLRELAGAARGGGARSRGRSWARPSSPRRWASFTGPGVVIIDDAERHRDCEAEAELSKLISFGADQGHGLILGGDAEALSGGFGGWHVEARRARRGCLIAPQTLPEGDLIGVRLSHSMTGETPKPGRALLNVGDGNADHRDRPRAAVTRRRPTLLNKINPGRGGILLRLAAARAACSCRATRACATARLRNLTEKQKLAIPPSSISTSSTMPTTRACSAKAITAPISMTNAAPSAELAAPVQGGGAPGPPALPALPWPACPWPAWPGFIPSHGSLCWPAARVAGRGLEPVRRPQRRAPKPTTPQTRMATSRQAPTTVGALSPNAAMPPPA